MIRVERGEKSGKVGGRGTALCTRLKGDVRLVGWYKGEEDILEMFAVLLGPIGGGGHDWNVCTDSYGYDLNDEHTQLQIREGGDL